MKTSRFEGRVVVVTGGASGIGLATAQAFAEHGATVVINDIRADAASAAAESIQAAGGKAAAFACDIADRDAVRQTAEEIVAGYGSIDILVNSAGITGQMPAEHYDHLDRLMAVNFYGTVYWAQAAANVSMIPNGRGSIVNVASIAGLVGIPNDIGYVSSKHAVLGLTKALAVEWARYGIRVNAVAPGVTDSPMVQDLADKFPDTMAARISRIPVNRTGRPEEQASGILFLASDDADYITGTTLAIDGGQMALNSGWSPSPQNVSAR